MSPERSQVLVIGSGLLAFALSVVLWRVVRFVVTIAHEGGHAMVASMMGGTVESIKVFSSRDPRGRGATAFRGVGPLGSFFTALAGYLGPSAFGIAGAMLLAHDWTVAVLWLTLFFLLLALFQIGNPLGAVAVVATGAVIVLVLRVRLPGPADVLRVHLDLGSCSAAGSGT